MKENMISIIVAMDEKRGIGRNNDLLFRIPEDFRRMTEITSGHPIVMGSNTFKSLGRILPGNRTHIVVTRDAKKVKNISFYKPEVKIASSLENGIELAGDCRGAEEIFIFGGGRIYNKAMAKKLVDKLYLTIVEGNFHADTFFPDYADFKKVVFEKKGESNGLRYKFLELEK
jgi:dihydrofolate reductase